MLTTSINAKSNEVEGYIKANKVALVVGVTASVVIMTFNPIGGTLFLAVNLELYRIRHDKSIIRLKNRRRTNIRPKMYLIQ